MCWFLCCMQHVIATSKTRWVGEKLLLVYNRLCISPMLHLSWNKIYVLPSNHTILMRNGLCYNCNNISQQLLNCPHFLLRGFIFWPLPRIYLAPWRVLDSHITTGDNTEMWFPSFARESSTSNFKLEGSVCNNSIVNMTTLDYKSTSLCSFTLDRTILAFQFGGDWMYIKRTQTQSKPPWT